MNLFQINFGIIAEDPVTKSVLHAVGYSKNPTQDDFDAIEEDLKTDPQFGH